jgi:hypothetical protein
MNMILSQERTWCRQLDRRGSGRCIYNVEVRAGAHIEAMTLTYMRSLVKYFKLIKKECSRQMVTHGLWLHLFNSANLVYIYFHGKMWYPTENGLELRDSPNRWNTVVNVTVYIVLSWLAAFILKLSLPYTGIEHRYIPMQNPRRSTPWLGQGPAINRLVTLVWMRGFCSITIP